MRTCTWPLRHADQANWACDEMVDTGMLYCSKHSGRSITAPSVPMSEKVVKTEWRDAGAPRPMRTLGKRL